MSSRHDAGRVNRRTWQQRVTAVTTLLFAVLLACVSCARFDPARRWSLDEVRAEFSKVKAPESARPIESTHLLKKYGTTTVSGRYAANESDEEVLKHYRTALLNNGWQFRSNVRFGDHFGESYCKTKLLATVELLNAGPPGAREYAFSVNWGEISEKKCP